MIRHVGLRLVLLFPSVLIASVVIFAVMRVLPGDVAIMILSGGGEATHSIEAREALRHELGLNDPLISQYFQWLGSMLSSEMGGQSLTTGQSVRSIIVRQAPVTALLTLYVFVLSIAVSLPAGIFAALRRDRWPDYAIRAVAIVGQGIPGFWLALVVIMMLLTIFQWSPPIVYAGPFDDPVRHLQIMAIPALALGWEFSAQVTRVSRASLLEVLGHDYVRTARGKGLPNRIVIGRHALRNALIPTAILIGLQFSALLGGTMILETIFGLPGLGRGLVHAALQRDYPVVQSLATLLVLATLVVNLLTDIIHARLDPRVTWIR